LGTDPRFTTREDRKENRHILRALLEQKLITQTADHWVPQLNRAGVPAGPVQSVPDALSDPQTTLRNLVQTIDGLDLMGSPVVQNGTRPHAQTPPPTLGQHNDDIWREMGLNPDDIQRLRQEGIL
jgi:formyl-CoA transferase